MKLGRRLASWIPLPFNVCLNFTIAARDCITLSNKQQTESSEREGEAKEDEK